MKTGVGGGGGAHPLKIRPSYKSTVEGSFSKNITPSMIFEVHQEAYMTNCTTKIFRATVGRNLLTESLLTN